MSAICRVNAHLLNEHERRRGQGVIAYRGDLLDSQKYWRSVRRTCAHAAGQYASHREASRRPVLGQLRMIEAAIRCDVMCRELVETMNGRAA